MLALGSHFVPQEPLGHDIVVGITLAAMGMIMIIALVVAYMRYLRNI